MKNKLIYSILSLLLLALLFKSCQKEEQELQIVPAITTLNDSLEIESRTGQTYPIFYLQSTSLTYHQENYQIAFNVDSIETITFNQVTPRIFTRALGTIDPSATKIQASVYNITINYKNNDSLQLPKSWIKDTVTVFNLIPNSQKGLVNNANAINITRDPNVRMNYYDKDFKRFKIKFLYNVTVDSIKYQDYLPAQNTGTVFWLNHKI